MRLLTAMLLLYVFQSASAQESGLGRLFFSPKQRAQLDYRHAHNAPIALDTPSVLMVNGIVQRHGGTRTVWINGAAKSVRNEDDTTAEPIAVPGSSHTVKLKVGQKLLLDSAATMAPSPAAD